MRSRPRLFDCLTALHLILVVTNTGNDYGYLRHPTLALPRRRIPRFLWPRTERRGDPRRPQRVPGTVPVTVQVPGPSGVWPRVVPASASRGLARSHYGRVPVKETARVQRTPASWVSPETAMPRVVPTIAPTIVRIAIHEDHGLT
jgi:hypothetical protein